MSLKALRQVLVAEVHRLTVTQADVDGPNAVTVDRTVLEAAGVMPHEKVEIANVSNGARFSATVAVGPANSGVVAVDGAGAHLARPQDLITLSVFGWVKGKAAGKARPRRVTVDANNSITAVVDDEPGAPSVEPPPPTKVKKPKKGTEP